MRWAVSHIDWINYNLTTEIVEAEDWIAALKQHPQIAPDVAAQPDWPDWQSLESVKQQFFDCDAMVECVAIPERS